MTVTKFKFLTFSLLLLGLTSCEKEMVGAFENYDNLQLVENTYTGRVEVTSTGTDPAGDFYGVNDSGNYSFAWKNTKTVGDVRFDITTPTGSVQMVIYDHFGVEVLNVTRSAGDDDTFSGLTKSGTPGTWLVTLILTDFNGDGSYSINPGN